jgi:phage tail sheath gpL-like
MPFSIPLTGLAANDPVPGNYLEVNFAQGAGSLGTATYAILLIGNKTTAGSATADSVIYGPGPNSPVALATVQDAIGLFGQGSELHRMYRRIVAINNTTPIYAVAVAESGGAAATLAITFATPATANGSVRLWVGDEFVDSPITSGDTVTTIAAAVAAAINTKLDWAVTATNAAGVLTITAKNKGPRGNWLRGSANIIGTGVGTTSSVNAQTFFTGGTTADSNSTALATILPFRYYYVVSAAEDATQFGAVSSQISTQALPITGIRARCIAGSVDTSGNATTIATGLNSARAELVWMQNSDWTPAELAANAAGVYALAETPLAFRCNYSGYGNIAGDQATWRVPAPRSGTAPTRPTVKAALNNGITPIAVNANGTTYLVKRITTRSLSGSNNDYRIRDAHKVTVCDRYGDDLLNKFGLQFTGKNVADDPPPGGRPLAPNVVSPRVVKAAVNKLTSDYSDLGLVQRADQIQAGTIVIRETSPTTRISCRVPLQTVDILDQVATALDQVA